MWKKEDDKIELVDIPEPACDCSGLRWHRLYGAGDEPAKTRCERNGAA